MKNKNNKIVASAFILFNGNGVSLIFWLSGIVIGDAKIWPAVYAILIGFLT